jgi:hypothetical protein
VLYCDQKRGSLAVHTGGVMDVWILASIVLAVIGLLVLIFAHMRPINVILRGDRHDATQNDAISADISRNGRVGRSNHIHAYDKPFNCAAFSIVSRKSIGLSRGERWLVDFTSPGWEDISKGVLKPAMYEEDEFRRLAALDGWRLVNVVPAAEKERRLYYERAYRSQ